MPRIVIMAAPMTIPDITKIKTLSDFPSGGCLIGEMHDQSDAQLLRVYAEHGTEAAFAEIVTRHTDLVYSAALRQVNSPDLACDVTQSVFTDLARKAREVSFKLSPEASLVGWLYRGTRFAARDLNRTEIRRTQRERQAMEQVHPTSKATTDWEQLCPALDDAVAELDDADRNALLLRYFKNHDLRTVGATLGISDDAAQKRVSRAVERLREFFAKRGVTTVGASGLAVVISANAVQAAPVGLALTVSTAAALTGTTFATTTTLTATKAIAMTTVQKTIITATIAVLAGVGIYEARQASQLRDQVQTLKQQRAPLTEQVAQMGQELANATNQLAALRNNNERLNQSSSELLRLRGEIARLRAAQSASDTNTPEDNIEIEAAAVAKRVIQIRKWLNQNPDQNIPELQALLNSDWLLLVAQFSKWDGTEQQMSFVTSLLRNQAKARVVRDIGNALADYASATGGQLPTTISELRHFLEPEVTDDMLARYELLHTANLNTLSATEPIISEKMPSQRGQYDAVYMISASGYSYRQLHALGSSGSAEFGGASKLKTFTKQ